ncbi:MAG: succinylglutamate desuccinylase/aspartoacylase family protein [Deltaproteobacteria bacterium]|nr:succinylglutamate desuccinylase/aspartoacylase family protein [Deltaproteobacteria bacterium]
MRSWCLKNNPICLLLFLLILGLGLSWGGKPWAKPSAKGRQHIVYFEGTANELEIYKIYGREEGPTIMLLGGIQGDEPGGFLSADLYVDLALKKGNLIIVPRANFKSIMAFARGSDGDMNRKFASDISYEDPDRSKIEIIKNLMGEADLFLNLHDGSGFYRNSWESEMANPSRYGQCIIADAEVYTHPETGVVLHLGRDARKVVEMINQDIHEENYKFRFANHDTLAPKTSHLEQRKSATYYALTELGIPAFGIETSKQLPSLEMKVQQHNLAINAFMKLYGVEPEHPRINLDPPRLDFMLISVNDGILMALRDGETLLVYPGDTIKVSYLNANFSRGLSCDVLNMGGLNDLNVPFQIYSPTAIIARKDNEKFGRVKIGLLSPDSPSHIPVLQDPKGGKIAEARGGFWRGEDPIPFEILALNPPSPSTQTSTQTSTQEFPSVSSPVTAPSDLPDTGGVSGFLLEVDGVPVTLHPMETLTVRKGSKITFVGISSSTELPPGVVLNFRGFVGRPGDTTGNDQGTTCDTARDMLLRFAITHSGQTLYQLGAEDGRNILAKAFIRIVPPVLKEVTLSLAGRSFVLPLAGRTKVAPGSEVILETITLEDSVPLTDPRITLGGKPVNTNLPQVMIMPTFAVSLAVFSQGELAGKVVLYP